jgi:thiamine pyrophosphate-dependent acetolactate synthase large subunit-like protein
MTDPAHHADTGAVERPLPAGVNAAQFGSDVVADALRALDIPYITLNPGASFRGLHDSLVNYLGNTQPQMLLCLHEESAVAIAHGYAKVTGRAMAVAVHSNVGLMHATMAIFNAWCDRMPMLVIGATGPVDAVKRRPWIDWIHTARDQGALVRDYTKWDDQPTSPLAAREAVLRANWIANTAPCGPTYVNLDAEMQEAKLTQPVEPIDAARFMPKATSAAPADLVCKAADLLQGAKRLLILAGRVSRSMESWQARIALAEALGARVMTDLKVGASFPTDHPLHAGAQGLIVPTAPWAEAVREADVLLSLDWVDLDGTLKAAFGAANPSTKIIQVSVDHHLHNGWSMDYQGLPPVDLFIAAEPDGTVAALLAALGPKAPAKTAKPVALPVSAPEPAHGPITVRTLTRVLRQSLGDRATTLTRLPLTFDVTLWPFRHPLDYLGFNGGGGLAAATGISIGAALALRGSGRMTVALCGDGDYLMGVTALWTAVHYKIPLLIVIYNNRSYFDDEMHQDRVARARNRPPENRRIGQRMNDPDIDVAGFARAQGARGYGPIADENEMATAFAQAIADVDNGHVAVVEILTGS